MRSELELVARHVAERPDGSLVLLQATTRTALDAEESRITGELMEAPRPHGKEG